MTRTEFIERYRHMIGGMVLDGATVSRHGADLSIFLRTVMSRTDSLLGQAYDNLIREGHREFEPPMTHMLPQMLGSTISDPAVLRALARAEFSKNTPSGTLKAIDYMRKVLGVTLPNIDDSLFLADLYARTQQERKAVEILEKARTASPYFREVYELLANDYMNLGQYGDAIAVLRQGIKLFPDDEKLRSLGKKADSVTLGPAK